MAALDPVSWLRQTPPFDGLPEARFAAAARALEVGFWPAGTWLVRAGGEPLAHLYVIRTGSVRLERGGQTIQVLEEGESFGYTSLVTRRASFDVLVETDLLAYRLPADAFAALVEDGRFASHFAGGLAGRLRASLANASVATFQPDLSLPVAELVRRPAVWIQPDATVRDAARVMREERISSVLVRGATPGIVTDRDFRNRVLAERLPPTTPLVQVLSTPIRSVDAATPVHEAWRLLLDLGVHHLPVTREGDVLGVLTAGDLLRATAQGPVAVLRSVERIASRELLPGYARRVAEMTAALLAGGLDAAVIAGFVARLDDALLERLLVFAEADLGPAPAPYAWLALGSEGRMEQTLHTDQDNALVYADAGAGRKDWYQALAERVNTDLEAAGFPRCPGNHMARRWNGPVAEWTRRLAACIDEPNAHDAALFFDFRRVGGDLDVEPLEVILARAPANPLFLRFLAREAMRFQPPGGMRLRLGGESSAVDLKWEGISPVVMLARCYGLEVRSRARATLERLDAARDAGLMAERTHAEVSEAYRFLLGLRLRVQLRLLRDAKPTSNRVPLADLGALERSRLKESLRTVKRWQERAAYHYQTDFL